MNFTIKVVMSAVLLCVVSSTTANAAKPFSWSTRHNIGVISSSVMVPEGMQWVVEYASGRIEVSTGRVPPIVKTYIQPEGLQEQILFLDMRLIGTDIDVGGRQKDVYSLNGSVTAYYTEQVFAETVGLTSNSIITQLSLIGYLRPLLTGDFNGDSVVNAADYTVFRDNLGTHWEPEEYQDWVVNFGASSSNGTAISDAVPEPSSILLAMFGGLAGMLMQPRRGDSL